jgi:hypothetical protein
MASRVLLALRRLQVEDFHVSFLFQVSNEDAPASCSAQIFKLLSFSGFTASKPAELLAPSRMLPTASSQTSGNILAPEQLANTDAVGCRAALDTEAATESALCSWPSIQDMYRCVHAAQKTLSGRLRPREDSAMLLSSHLCHQPILLD